MILLGHVLGLAYRCRPCAVVTRHVLRFPHGSALPTDGPPVPCSLCGWPMRCDRVEDLTHYLVRGWSLWLALPGMGAVLFGWGGFVLGLLAAWAASRWRRAADRRRMGERKTLGPPPRRD